MKNPTPLRTVAAAERTLGRFGRVNICRCDAPAHPSGNGEASSMTPLARGLPPSQLNVTPSEAARAVVRHHDRRPTLQSFAGDCDVMYEGCHDLLARSLTPAERRLVAVARIRSTDRTRSVAVIAVIAYAAEVVDVETATDLAIEAEAFQTWLEKQNWQRHRVKSEAITACVWITAEILRQGLADRGEQTDRFSAMHHEFWAALALKPLTKNALRKKRCERTDPMFERYRVETTERPMLVAIPTALTSDEVLRRPREKVAREQSAAKAA